MNAMDNTIFCRFAAHPLKRCVPGAVLWLWLGLLAGAAYAQQPSAPGSDLRSYRQMARTQQGMPDQRRAALRESLRSQHLEHSAPGGAPGEPRQWTPEQRNEFRQQLRQQSRPSLRPPLAGQQAVGQAPQGPQFMRPPLRPQRGELPQ